MTLRIYRLTYSVTCSNDLRNWNEDRSMYFFTREAAEKWLEENKRRGIISTIEVHD